MAEATATMEEEFLKPSQTLAGYIFRCNNTTMPICLDRMVFGLGESYIDSVKQITPGTGLFLYNCNTGLLHGIFEAADTGGDNIDPEFCPDNQNPGRSLYPAQVRVKWWWKHDEPLTSEVSKGILKELRVKKKRFRIELNPSEVLKIVDAFHRNQNSRKAIVRKIEECELRLLNKFSAWKKHSPRERIHILFESLC